MQDEETCECDTLVKVEFKISNINRSAKLKEKQHTNFSVKSQERNVNP